MVAIDTPRSAAMRRSCWRNSSGTINVVRCMMSCYHKCHNSRARSALRAS
jgi:hypothetical protein